MKNELIITRDIVEKYENKFIENDDRKFVIYTFNEVFPHGAKVTDIPKLIPELDDDYPYFAEWLLKELPFNEVPLELDTLQDGLFYNGNVHLKSHAHIPNTSLIKGELIINGKLSARDSTYLYALHINAYEIDIADDVEIYAQIKTNSINIRDVALIFGNTTAKVINFKGGSIRGNVDADEIINDGGLIWGGDVYTHNINIINGGIVDGFIFYKSPDEHK